MLLSPDRTWHGNNGASKEALDALRSAVVQTLPSAYFELLEYSNGGEGPLPPPFYNLCLDSVEVASDPEQLRVFSEMYPELFVFGGDGGSQLFAFDFRGKEPWPIVSFDGVDPFGSIEKIADSFEAFLQFVGRDAL